MTEGTVITEQEVRNQRAMINDTILVGTNSGHTINIKQMKTDTLARGRPVYICRYTWSPFIIQLKFYLLYTAQI